jgi:cytochrome c oxidase subunit 4
MTIAVVKALLVLLYFMHLRYGSHLNWIFAGASFFWLAILLSLTVGDYLTRGW